MGTYSDRLLKTQPGVTKLIGKDGNITYLEDIYQTLVEQLWDSGVATSGNGTTCVNSLVAMETDLYKGGIIEVQIGTKSHSRLVLSNNATTFTFAALDGGALVVAGCKYQVKQKVNSFNLLQVGGTVLTADDWTLLFRTMNKEKAATPVQYVVDCAVANQEYSQALPASTKMFTVKMLNGLPGDNFRVGYVTGNVATGPLAAKPCDKIDAGMEFVSPDGMK
jgi:hypothetical protein